MRMRIGLLALGLVAASCSGGTAERTPESSVASTAAQAVPSSTMSTVPADRSDVSVSTAVTPTTTSPAAPPTSTTDGSGVPLSVALEEFIAAAEELDARIRAASDLFNETVVVDPPGCAALDPFPDDCIVLVPPSTVKVIEDLSRDDPIQGIRLPADLDGDLLADLIPAGLDADVQAAVLAVYADLDSRIAALTAMNWDCFERGARSARRFPADFEALRGVVPAVTGFSAPRSSTAGYHLAVEVYLVQLFNHGCNDDVCGGYVYEGRVASAGGVPRAAFDIEVTWVDNRWDVSSVFC